MQKLIAISLLFAFSFQCFSSVSIWASYELNKSYIANALCVNRDKPAMHCDGKCFLNKKLNEDQHRKQDEKNTSGNKIEIVLFCETQEVQVYPQTDTHNIFFSKQTTPYHFISASTFFHPPEVS